MKVLMLVSRLNLGGTEKYILSISQYLQARGVQVGVASMGGPLMRSFQGSGIKVHLLSGDESSALKQLSSIITRESYRMVNAHDSKSFRYAAALHRQRKIPLIVTVHGTYHHKPSLLTAAKAARRIITVSPKLSKWLIGLHLPPSKIKTILNGINTSVFHPASQLSEKGRRRQSLHLPSSAQLLVYAGRFSHDKYPIARKVIMAAERIARNNRHFAAVLYGPGSLRSQLAQQAAEVNRRLGRQAVYVRPPLSSIQHAYYAADVVVGTGRVALEAMACAKPVVATGVAGYCGIVAPSNVNRIIQCHFGDHGALGPLTVQRLANDINQLLNNPRRARQLGDFGLRTVRGRYSMNKVGSQLIQYYK
ncbi:glycosyltransferase [Paenibacillus mendelii]|uniref:Glycosyltransferase n=1 Tax=Paenibacillus mendelii TaxID=206163 RepID=A0ABV6J243_9BACL|nr:glycosyltransferase [Paenibacillus mendelii]MCQ6562881.1 glycosyltransferase [Paenibacillus mendelii]